jgi:dephospho-CoA kinase
MLRVGLTGGIACGKSHVLRGLARAGIATLDLDVIAHEVLRPGGPAFDEVVEEFGPKILGDAGDIDRHALARRVFADGASRARLNAIMHPHIREEEELRTQAVGGGSRLIVTDGALIIESGGHLRFDRLVVAHCPEAQQIARLKRRDGLSEEDARGRLRAQLPAAEKLRFASFEIDTSGTSDATDTQVQRLASALTELARVEAPRGEVSRAQATSCLANGPDRGVRGLTPRKLARQVAEAGVIELAELAKSLDPPGRGPWYEAAAGEDAGACEGPEELTAVAVLWVIGRRGVDRQAAIAAAASLARLTHSGGEAIAGACLVADALVDAALNGPAWGERRAQGHWQAEARKWGAAAAPARVVAAVEAAGRWPSDFGKAGAECRRLSGDPGICGALVGLSGGVGEAAAQDAELTDACRRMGFVD